MKRILILFLVVCMFSISNVSAHTFPKMCISGTENSNGYVVDCANHQASNSFTYAVGSLNSSYSSYVTNGASKWSGTVAINKAISSYTAQGHIHTYSDPDVSTVAAFYDYQSYSSGHLYDWKIKMNTSLMEALEHNIRFAAAVHFMISHCIPTPSTSLRTKISRQLVNFVRINGQVPS